jgi:ketosteroid isomerase-like protein
MKKTVVVLIILCLSAPLFAQDGLAMSNANENDPVRVVKEFLTAYMAGDHQKFSHLLHPDVLWIQPGDNRISGVKKSKTELLQMGARMSELSAKTLKLVDVTYYSSNGNSVVCILHWQAAQPTGLVLDINNIDVYTVENGKIVMARIFSENIEKEDQFWGK